jgi:hypothetical protein
MQTATLGSVPCLPCDIGTVLSQQPIACQARRVRGWTKTPSKIPGIGRSRHRSVASIKMSVDGFDDARKANDILSHG